MLPLGGKKEYNNKRVSEIKFIFKVKDIQQKLSPLEYT